MYRIVNITTGEEIGFADSIRYIKSNGGTYVVSKENDATGIAYRSKAYSLAGTDGISGLDYVAVFPVQSDTVMTETKQMTDELLLSILKG